MTESELQEVVAAVIQSLKTNGKTISQLTEVTTLADTDYIELSSGRKVSYETFKGAIADEVEVTTNQIKGYVVITSTSDLPETPTADEQMIGYLLGTVLYVYVGEDGDTLDGLYQSVQMKGEDGAQGPAGADGADGANGVSLGDVVLVDDLTTGGSDAALSAQQGVVLKGLTERLPVAEARNLFEGYIPGSTLPSGYTELDYISTNGGATQLVISHIIPQSGAWRFVGSFARTNSGGTWGRVLYAQTQGANSFALCYGGAYSKMAARCFTSSGASSNATMSNSATDVWHTFDLSYGKLILDGVENAVSTTMVNVLNTTPLELFDSALHMKLGSFAAYEGDVLKLMLIPCKNSSDVAGMYDLVSGTFYSTSANETAYTAGDVTTTKLDKLVNTEDLALVPDLIDDKVSGVANDVQGYEITDFSPYPFYAGSDNGGTWSAGGAFSYLVPIKGGVTIEVTCPSTNYNASRISFLTSNTVATSGTITNYADGESSYHSVAKGSTETMTVPSDATYMLVRGFYQTTANLYTPSKIKVSGMSDKISDLSALKEKTKEFEQYGVTFTLGGFYQADGTRNTGGAYHRCQMFDLTDLAGYVIYFYTQDTSISTLRYFVLLDDNDSVLYTDDGGAAHNASEYMLHEDIDALIEAYPTATKVAMSQSTSNQTYFVPKESYAYKFKKVHEQIDGPTLTVNFTDTAYEIVSNYDDDAVGTEDGNVNCGWIGKLGNYYYLIYSAAAATDGGDNESNYYLRVAYSSNGTTWQRGFPEDVTPPVSGTNLFINEGGLGGITIVKVPDATFPYRIFLTKTTGTSPFTITVRMYRSADGIHIDDTYMSRVGYKEIMSESMNLDGHLSAVVRGNLIKLYTRDWWDKTYRFNRQVGVFFVDFDGNLVLPLQRMSGGDFLYEAPAIPIDDRRELLMPTFMDNLTDGGDDLHNKLKTFVAENYHMEEFSSDLNDVVQNDELWARVCAGSIFIGSEQYIALNTSEHNHDNADWMKGDAESKTRLVKITIAQT